MDDQRVHAHAGGVPAARRVARRSLWPPPGVLHRHDLVCRRVAFVWHRSEHRAADHSSRASGRRSGALDTREPGDHRGELSSRGPRGGSRRMVGPRRHRRGARAVCRRISDPGRLVAADLPDQPAAGRGHRMGRATARPRDTERKRAWHASGHPRRGPHGTGACSDDVWLDSGRRVRVGVGGGARHARRGRCRVRRVRPA